MAKLTKEQIEQDFTEYKRKKKEIIDNNLPLEGIKYRKIIRPLMRFLLFGQRIIKGQKIKVIGNKHYKIPEGRQVIFVVSHIGKFDFEMVNEKIKQQFYVLASDYRNMHGNFNGFMMNLFGVIFLDQKDPEDKQYTYELTKKYLRNKCHMMILSEGTWNLSPNEIIMDTHFGAVSAGIEENALILPISIEQYKKDFVINIGEFYDPSIEAKHFSEENKELDTISEDQEFFNIKKHTNTIMRDDLAGLKLDIWNLLPPEERAKIPADYWEKFIEERRAEWPGYDMQEQIDNVVHTKEKKLYKQVLEDYENIHPNDNSLFLFASDERFDNYLDVLKRNDEIESTLDAFREKQEDIEPIEIRLEKYKTLKKINKNS